MAMMKVEKVKNCTYLVNRYKKRKSERKKERQVNRQCDRERERERERVKEWVDRRGGGTERGGRERG
jgi:hypothetical protein